MQDFCQSMNVGYFVKITLKVRYTSVKIGIRNGNVFKAMMAHLDQNLFKSPPHAFILPHAFHRMKFLLA